MSSDIVVKPIATAAVAFAIDIFEMRVILINL